MIQKTILSIFCFLYAFNWSVGQSEINFTDVFYLDQLNTIHILFQGEDWRDDLDRFGEFTTAVIHVNNEQAIGGKLARKGNSSNSNTILRDKFPMKFDGPGSFNFKLNNNYRDYTMGAREYLGYKLHKAFTGIGSDVAVADVYINDQYYGMFNIVEDLNKGFYRDKVGLITERVKSSLTATGKLEDKISSNLNWLGEDLELYKGRYEVKDGKLATLVSLIDIMNNSPEEAHNHIDIEQVIRYIVVENYIMNTDGIIGKKYSHNYELIKRATDNKWQLVPWDLNLCFGAFSESLFSEEEIPIDEIVKIHPTLGGENNGLIRLVTEHYRFLYHHLYSKLLWQYPADKLVDWANDFRKIVNSSSEVDDKLYEKDLWRKAYQQNLLAKDGYVPGLIPIIRERYDYLQSINFTEIFYNRIVSISEENGLLTIITTPGVKKSKVMIEYQNAAGENKTLRPTASEEIPNTYTHMLPKDLVSYYVVAEDLGVRFSYPYNGKLAPIQFNRSSSN